METQLIWHDADKELPKDACNVFVAIWDENFPNILQCDIAANIPCDYKDSKGRDWQTCNDWYEGQKWFVAYWAYIPEFDLKRHYFKEFRQKLHNNQNN